MNYVNKMYCSSTVYALVWKHALQHETFQLQHLTRTVLSLSQYQHTSFESGSMSRYATCKLRSWWFDALFFQPWTSSQHCQRPSASYPFFPFLLFFFSLSLGNWWSVTSGAFNSAWELVEVVEEAGLSKQPIDFMTRQLASHSWIWDSE